MKIKHLLLVLILGVSMSTFAQGVNYGDWKYFSERDDVYGDTRLAITFSPHKINGKQPAFGFKTKGADAQLIVAAIGLKDIEDGIARIIFKDATTFNTEVVKSSNEDEVFHLLVKDREDLAKILVKLSEEDSMTVKVIGAYNHKSLYFPIKGGARAIERVLHIE